MSELTTRQQQRGNMKYLIWPNEHNSWWKADHLGYTDHAHLAGRYTKEEALQICNGANYGWDTDRRSNTPDELPVEESIAMELEYKIFGELYEKPETE